MDWQRDFGYNSGTAPPPATRPGRIDAGARSATQRIHGVYQMIQHTVLFKWRDDTRSETIKDVVRAIETLRDIETIRDFACGHNFTRNGAGYSFALSFKLPDRAALKAFWSHPLHEHVLVVVQPHAADVLVSDFEIL
jgi:hypothetical protein